MDGSNMDTEMSSSAYSVRWHWKGETDAVTVSHCVVTKGYSKVEEIPQMLALKYGKIGGSQTADQVVIESCVLVQVNQVPLVSGQYWTWGDYIVLTTVDDRFAVYHMAEHPEKDGTSIHTLVDSWYDLPDAIQGARFDRQKRK